MDPVDKSHGANIHALINYEDPYVQPLILGALKSRLPEPTYELITSLAQLPTPRSPLLQWVQYESIDFDHLYDHRTCHAKRKDGKDCGSWIDGRKTEFCEFHVQLQVEKSKKGRMEINTMAGFGNGPGAGKHGMFGGRKGGFKGDELKREGRYHDRGLHETVYIASGPGGAARMLDNDEDQGFERGASREERFRKQLAAKEKERELAKRLGTMGDGSTGGDYMKIRSGEAGELSSQASSIAASSKPGASDFSSLLDRTAADVSLAPVKRKRIASGKSTASSEPVGWGFRYGRIPSPKKEVAPSFSSALRSTREVSPAKKKARLLLPEKGIREPGRESIGGLDVGLIAAMDDDDDDLEVI